VGIIRHRGGKAYISTLSHGWASASIPGGAPPKKLLLLFWKKKVIIKLWLGEMSFTLHLEQNRYCLKGKFEQFDKIWHLDGNHVD